MSEKTKWTKGPLYAERDIEQLGEHYMRHVDGMTRQELYSKSSIAAELGYRDMLITDLYEACEALLGATFLSEICEDEIEAARQVARAALAKARGEGK